VNTLLDTVDWYLLGLWTILALAVLALAFAVESD
jgi:hypothetical protein